MGVVDVVGKSGPETSAEVESWPASERRSLLDISFSSRGGRDVFVLVCFCFNLLCVLL